ncbi:Neural Wiskott-Aldrich syndrome protein [Zootermopsis nevadensis]|uniref:Neural Wiskott-Aldrich syndrome protein n=2 Tax=Zootermopsis nevadensis TaxID=136037 RepID=A0A067QZG7_ZOONE|nr:Neural Wiskott-Aldrich syndrome protein [Zootermopsis nevadensis]
MRSESGTDHHGSMLLTHDENEQIYRLLGNRCQTLATGVVQLFVTDPPDHSAWRRSDAGVLCLVKDNQRRSYFFRLYCLTRCQMVWEHELYNSMDYKCPKMWLHTFEGEECIVAFNFASEDEARCIKIVLNEKLEARKQRRLERRSRSSMQPSHKSVSSGHGGNLTGSHMGSSSHLANGSLLPSPRQQHRTKTSGKKKDKDSKRRLTKADIGLPKDFRHVSHVGWDPNKGFDLDNVEDPQLKLFFDKAGVSDSQLQDRETREFIYDFINRHGGLDAVKDEVVYPQAPQPPVGPPPVPARSAPISNFQYQAR